MQNRFTAAVKHRTEPMGIATSLDPGKDGKAAGRAGTPLQAQRPEGLSLRPPQPGTSAAGAIPPRQPHVLAQHADLPFSIHRHQDDGQVTLQQDLKLRRLVLTGGGAKGAVYPGAIKALENTGQLAHIREVGGTSIGAIVAALLAAGMDADGCKALLDQINLPLLFSRTEKPAAELKKPVRLGRMRSKLSIASNLGSKAPNLKGLIDQTTRESALERINALEPLSNADVQRISNKLAAGGTLSLGDLRTLSDHVPGIKDLYCTSTAVYSGPGVQGKVRQLAVFSSTDDDCKDMELSAAVCASAALPVVFKARQHPMPHDLADSKKTRTRFTDGGLTLNTPIRELIDPDTPPAENLILSFEDPRTTRARQGAADTKPPSFAGDLSARVAKTIPVVQHFISRRKFLAHELVHGPLAHQTLEIKLKGVAGHTDYSGSKGRLAIWMTQAEKDELQDHLNDGVRAHLEQRSGHKTFPSLHHLMFSLTSDELRPLRDRCTTGDTPAIEEALRRVDDLRDSLGHFLDTMKDWHDDKQHKAMADEVTQWMAQVDMALGPDEPCRDAFAQALAGDPAPPVQRLFDILRHRAAPADEQGLHAACLRKDEERATHRIAQRIRSEFIYPAVDKPLQVSRNDAALRRADKDLSLARTRAEINAALRKLESAYEVMGSKALKDLSPVVSKLRTYYLTDPPAGQARAPGAPVR